MSFLAGLLRDVEQVTLSFTHPAPHRQDGSEDALPASANHTSLDLLTVLMPYRCHNKLSQTGRLKPTEVYSLTELEARLLKSRCGQDHTPAGTLKGSSFSVSSPSCWLWASHANHSMAASCQGLLGGYISSFFTLCQVSLCFTLTRTPVIALRVHQVLPDELIISRFLIEFHLQDPFQVR